MAINFLNVINHMEMQILNLEIQLAQLENDAAARGAMVAAEHLKKEVSILKKFLKKE